MFRHVQPVEEKAKLSRHPVSNCHGSGLVQKTQKNHVHVPPGMDEGYQLRLRGEGEMAGNGGEPGDLYVIVHVRPRSAVH